MSEYIGKNKVVESIFWKTSERLLSQVATLIVQIILARILFPKDYAVVAIVLALTGVLAIIIQGGYSSVIVQKKDLNNIDLSSIFLISSAVSIFIYIAIFFLSPNVASIFNNDQITNVFRVMGLTLVFGVYGNIQNSLAVKYFKFKGIFVSAFASTVVSGLVGVSMAYSGYGTWSLVAQSLVNQVVAIIILIFYVKWRPRLKFNKQSFKYMFGHGFHLFFPSLLYSAYKNMFSLIIGKSYGNTALGYYDRGRTIPEYTLGNVNNAVQSVILPTFSIYQSDLGKLKYLARRVIRMLSFVMFPMCLSLVALSGNIVHVLLTDKWAPVVIYFQLIALFNLHIPISHINQRILLSLGKTRRVMVLNIIEVAIGFTVLGIMYRFGPVAIMAGYTMSSIPTLIMYIIYSGKTINYSFIEQIKDVSRPLFASLVMFSGLCVVSGMRGVSALMFQLLFGVMLYLFMSRILKIRELKELMVQIIEYKNKIGVKLR